MNWKDKAIAATIGSQLGAIITCVLDREAQGLPRFSGKASVTSDAFVMCNFVSSEGDSHMGAFVGSLNDLERNVVGLADHLKLNAQERGEYTDAIVAWISTDYCGAAARLRKALEVRN